MIAAEIAAISSSVTPPKLDTRRLISVDIRLIAMTNVVRNTNTVPMPASISVRPSFISESCIFDPVDGFERRIILKSNPLKCFSDAAKRLESGLKPGQHNISLKQSDRKICASDRLWGFAIFVCLVFSGVPPKASAEDSAPQQIATGSTIDRIVIERRNVFDLENPKENNAVYRFVNRWHIITREKTVSKQLLFGEGDSFDPRLLEESERILRGNRYLYDASLTPKPSDQGGVDIHIATRDVWSLTPELSLSRSGGENKTILGFEESNLLGYGQRIQLDYEDSIDRISTAFEYSDRHIANSWVAIGLRIADNSDGHSRLLNMAKPFHALDARWSAGFTAYDDDRRSALYILGNEAAEYRHERSLFSAFGGWSSGLRNSWVRRWTAGIVHDDNRFSQALDPTLPPSIPVNRKLTYPFVGLELFEDRFEKSSNHNQIERSEDFYLGTRLYATLGWSSTDFDSDRDALIYSLSLNHSFGSLNKKALLLTVTATGREESGNTANAIASLNARYYWQQSDKRLFFSLLEVTRGHNPDLDNPIEIGGNNGLRGYPLRYQSGDSRLLLSIEQRYFTDWYPFRLFRIGGAVFFDVGRVWGNDPLGGPNLGWLKDVGIGLRFAPTRIASQKLFHLDIAFPLDGDPTIDEVQISFEAKRGF